MGGCQNYGPFWGTLSIRCRTILGPKRGHNFDNHPHGGLDTRGLGFWSLGVQGLGFRGLGFRGLGFRV